MRRDSRLQRSGSLFNNRGPRKGFGTRATSRQAAKFCRRAIITWSNLRALCDSSWWSAHVDGVRMRAQLVEL